MISPKKNTGYKGLLCQGFNQKNFLSSLSKFDVPDMASLQKVANLECLGLKKWPKIDKINAWMLSSETATFMKWGGLGMVASELSENFNKVFKSDAHEISIITPMYEGNTGKKSAKLEDGWYFGSEKKKIEVSHITNLEVLFSDLDNNLVSYPVEVYQGTFNGVSYIFFRNQRFFSITPAKENPSLQDACYVLNEHHINEVERFAFFSKTIWTLLCDIFSGKIKEIKAPNILLANDWHTGALGGLCKYFAPLKAEKDILFAEVASRLSLIPIIHIVHHLGYQGWDYPNTRRLLNALYEDCAQSILENAKSIKNNNFRTNNTLIVYDCYNQVSSNLHLADRVVTVSENYMEEVSNELNLGFDFRDLLKIRKENHTFWGIVNGYEKKLISPNEEKIKHLNEYFKNFEFKIYDENSIDEKTCNKKECLKLLSLIAKDEKFKKECIPLLDIYKFDDISDLEGKVNHIPFMCATSRLFKQKGYDIACKALLNVLGKIKKKKLEFPVIMLGGAGDLKLYEMLKNFKRKVQKISYQAARRIFVFRGYLDEFAYAIQLATDFYLMPSRFEPCGLTQMEAMAKGSLPITTSTGGLVDTIKDGIDGFRTDVFFVQGIKVYDTGKCKRKIKGNAEAYTETLCKALRCFYNSPELIKSMKINAMKKDFSWDTKDGAVYKYYKLFKTGAL